MRLMKLRIFFVLIGFTFFGISIAQSKEIKSDTIFNTIDSAGLKQGFWKKFYPNENIRYTGQFNNNKPIGEFRRYYEEKGLQSILIYDEDGKSSAVEFYYNNGELAATGKYIGTEKDGVWKYYSYYGGFLSKEEHYKIGKKNGASHDYYENGTISQEIIWQNGVKNGIWKIWFSDASLQLETHYINGILNGGFTTYYPDGTVEIQGVYKDNIRIGSWEYTDLKTKEIRTIKYINGLPENQDEIDKKFLESMEEYEKNKNKIKEPDLNDFNIKR